MEIQYSGQAKGLIKHLKDFDQEDFERWYKEEYMAVVGGGQILEYLRQRDRKEYEERGG